MILSGIKKEEYREIKPYYMTRFSTELGKYGNNDNLICVLRNGYRKDSPSIKIRYRLCVKIGNTEWGGRTA
jgi:hypothetical protein